MIVVRVAASVVLTWAVAGCQAIENDPLLSSSAAKPKPALTKSAFEEYGAKPLTDPGGK